MICVVLMCCAEDVNAKTVSKNGFSYDDEDYTVTWKSERTFYVYTEKGGKLGTVKSIVGIAKLNGYTDYTLMVKLVTTPNDKCVKRNNGLAGYGFNEYVSVKTYVPGQLGEYRPDNPPETSTVEFSIGADKDGPSIGVNYSITKSDIDITAKCDTDKELFYEVFDYKPSIVNIFASNKYVANERSQYCMAQFETGKIYHTFKLTIDGRFGMSYGNDSRPIDIMHGYIRKATDTPIYCFKLR